MDYKITIDNCIIFDYLRADRSDYKKARFLFSQKNIILYITETVMLEVKDTKQQDIVNDLIKQGKLNILPQPQMGAIIPAIVPIDFSHISPVDDKAISDFMKKRGIKNKGKVLFDFLIAVAHKRNNNDYLLTNNTKDFSTNLPIKICNYTDLFKNLNLTFSK